MSADHSVLSIDIYAYESPLNRVNAGFKCLFCIVTLIACIGFNNPVVSLLVLIAVSAVLILKGNMKLPEWLHLLRIPLFFTILATVVVMFDFSKNVVGQWHLTIGNVCFYTTKQMLCDGIFLFLRVMAAVSTMFFLTLTTPAHELIYVLKKIHIPAMIIELMYLIYRYIFILFEANNKMKISAEARLGFCDYLTSLKTFGSIAGNLLVVLLHKANTYYDAMESRCYDGELAFLEEEKPWQAILVIAAVAFEILLAVVSVLWKWKFT